MQKPSGCSEDSLGTLVWALQDMGQQYGNSVRLSLRLREEWKILCTVNIALSVLRRWLPHGIRNHIFLSTLVVLCCRCSTGFQYTLTIFVFWVSTYCIVCSCFLPLAFRWRCTVVVTDDVFNPSLRLARFCAFENNSCRGIFLHRAKAGISNRPIALFHV